jgi:L-lactate dehydrogenase (cytochrome)
MRMQPRAGTSLDRRLARAHTIEDLRVIGMRHTPRPVFDYVDGAADDEIALRRSREVFERLTFHPHVLRDVSEVDTTTSFVGRAAAMPIAFGPTGFTRMMQHEGERAVARAASRAGLPYTLSTMSTTSIADVVAASNGGDVWFQLYVWRDRARSKDLIEQARDAGARALMLTVDVPVPGARLRDNRGGLTIPPTLTLRTLTQIARFPRWWINLLTTEPLTFANFSQAPTELHELIASMFDPAVGFDDVEWLRGAWDGPLIVKGIQRVDDARDIVAAGADAVVLSNHGARQLDRAVTPLELVPATVDAVGDRAEIYVDTGVRSGADVAAAIALGARGCFVGRAYMYGLMAGGERGVERAASILREQLRRTMALLGARNLAELTPDLVSLAG